jgi:hypothetical protein
MRLINYNSKDFKRGKEPASEDVEFIFSWITEPER